MAFCSQPFPIRPYQKALSLDDGFEKLFNDLIDFDSVDFPEAQDSAHQVQFHPSSRAESTTSSKIGVDASIIPENKLSNGNNIESRLWEALGYFSYKNDAALSPLVKSRLQPCEPCKSRRPAKEAQESSLSLTNCSIQNSQMASHAPLDGFLSSPLQSSQSSPLLPLAESFGSLAIRRKNSKTLASPSTSICKFPRQPSMSPRMQATTQYQQSAEWGRGCAGTAPEHINIRNSMALGQMITPPTSASYQKDSFSGGQGFEFPRDLISPLQQGCIGNPNTPVETPYFGERSTSTSSLESIELPQYPHVPVVPSTIIPSPGCRSMEMNYSNNGTQQAEDQWMSANSSMVEKQPSRQNFMPNAGLGIMGISDQMPIPVMKRNGPMRPPQPAPSIMSMGGRPPPSTIAPSSLMCNSTDRVATPFSASASLDHMPLNATLRMQTNDPNNIRYLTQCLQQNQYGQNLTVPQLPIPGQSMGMLPPERQSRSPQPSRSPRMDQNHRRTKSNGKIGRKSAGASSRSPRHASLGFVNYTPNDSEKILTGVAPSGSSKTKARREKEAQARRRKDLEAAKNAVVRAGGDVNLFVQESQFAALGGI